MNNIFWRTVRMTLLIVALTIEAVALILAYTGKGLTWVGDLSGRMIEG